MAEHTAGASSRAELLEIVCGTTGAVVQFALLAQHAYLLSQLRSRKAARSRRKREHGLGDPAHSWFVEVDATYLGFAQLHRSGKLLQSFIRDEALIDAGERIQEPLQHAF